MINIQRAFLCAALLSGAASFAAAATMEGTISDSMCGASHAKMIEMHKDAKMTDRDCTLACLSHGAKYVFVSEGKVYRITNQNLPALMKEAGEDVTLTGDVSGDTITVSHMSKARHQ
jgi:hypothetical protein